MMSLRKMCQPILTTSEDMNEAKEKALVEMAKFFNKMVQKYKKAIEELKD